VNNFFRIIALPLAALMLSACASSPGSKDMTETEISHWRVINVGVTNARKFRKAGLEPSTVQQWQEAGIFDTEVILDWNKSGYTPDSAGLWLQQGFSPKQAKAWSKKKFSASEARAWQDAGFSLKKAVRSRSKGLTPVR
jgi:hypothetical protein